MRRTLVLGLAALLVTALWAVPAGASSPAKITVVHGIPGDALGLAKALPVDVCLADGTRLLSSVPFKGNNARSPLQVPAGTYAVEVRPDVDRAVSCEGPAVLAASLKVEPGRSYTAVAALTEGLQPGAADQLGLGIDLFVVENKTRRVGTLQSRTTIGHFADAPPVDVYEGRAKGPGNRLMSVLLRGVPNGAAAVQDFFFGNRWFGLAIAPSAGPRDIAVGPVRLWLERGADTIVLAVGSLDKGSRSPFGLGSFDFITYTQR